MAEPWRPPIELLLWAGVTCMADEKVMPPSVERETMIGSALPGPPWKRVQLTYTVPAKCDIAPWSTQIAILSLKSAGLVRSVASTGLDQCWPPSVERETVSSSELVDIQRTPARLPEREIP